MAGLSYDAYKVDATVVLLNMERGYVKAQDANGIEYFIFVDAIETMGRWDFGDLRFASRVRLTPIDHPRGRRGIEVQIVEL